MFAPPPPSARPCLFKRDTNSTPFGLWATKICFYAYPYMMYLK